MNAKEQRDTNIQRKMEKRVPLWWGNFAQTGIVASDNRERKENEPMGAVLISHCGRSPCQLFPQNKILTTRVRAAVFWGLLIK